MKGLFHFLTCFASLRLRLVFGSWGSVCSPIHCQGLDGKPLERTSNHRTDVPISHLSLRPVDGPFVVGNREPPLIDVHKTDTVFYPQHAFKRGVELNRSMVFPSGILEVAVPLL